MKPKYSDGRYPHGYKMSHETDITKTWARARKEIEETKSKREELRKKVEQIPHIGKRQS